MCVKIHQKCNVVQSKGQLYKIGHAIKIGRIRWIIVHEHISTASWAQFTVNMQMASVAVEMASVAVLIEIETSDKGSVRQCNGPIKLAMHEWPFPGRPAHVTHNDEAKH